MPRWFKPLLSFHGLCDERIEHFRRYQAALHHDLLDALVLAFRLFHHFGGGVIADGGIQQGRKAGAALEEVRAGIAVGDDTATYRGRSVRECLRPIQEDAAIDENIDRIREDRE